MMHASGTSTAWSPNISAKNDSCHCPAARAASKMDTTQAASTAPAIASTGRASQPRITSRPRRRVGLHVDLAQGASLGLVGVHDGAQLLDVARQVVVLVGVG